MDIKAKELDNNFLIYRSSAGSGKTFTLVKEYLKLSLPQAKFEDILAITFTNKAANEMKSRILEELSKMKNYEKLEYKDKGMLLALCDEFGRSVDEMKQKAINLETRILHNYSDFSVYTIDSFTQKIIQTFAYDLNIPLNYKVILEKEEIKQKAVNDLLDMVGTPGKDELTKIITKYIEEQMEVGDNWNIESKLQDVSDEIFKETAADNLNKIKDITLDQFAKIYEEHKNEIRNFEQDLITVAKVTLKKIDSEGFGASDFYQGSRGVYGYLEKTSKGAITKCNSYVLDFLNDENKRLSAKSDKRDRAEGILQDILKTIEYICEKLDNDYKTYCTQKVLIKKIYGMALLNAISDNIKEYQDADEVLHISEFNKRISEVVLNQPVPFLYERLGERYKHFLIDEFQDTSVMQWQNLLPLITNSLSTGDMSLVVGDGKQAIYRFRQGEVEQFVKLPDVYNPQNNPIIDERAEELKPYGCVKNLDNNYRTGKVIVEFNNKFFKSIVERKLADNDKIADIYLGEDYRNRIGGGNTIDCQLKDCSTCQNKPLLCQKSKKEGGYVSIKLVESDTADEIKNNIYESIYDIISDLVLNKGYDYKDIAILARKNGELNEILKYLSVKRINGKDIPMISSESYLLKNNDEIMFLYSMLSMLVNPTDKASQLFVMEYLSNNGYLKDSYISYFANIKSREYDIYGLLNELFKEKGNSINESDLLSKTIYDCCESIVRLFSLNKRSPLYIASFLNVVASYSSENKQDLSEFLEYFLSKINTLSVKTSSEANAVELYTIHKSKGLEFKVVIYPIVPERAKNAENIWVNIDEKSQKKYRLPIALMPYGKLQETTMSDYYNEEFYAKQMDDLNVLYVAMTRPKEKLFVCLGKKKTKSDEKNGKTRDFVSYFMNYLGDRLGNEECYSEGEYSNKVKSEDKKETKTSVEIVDLISNDWSDKISISPEKTLAVQEGNLLHEILSQIYTAADIENVLERYKNKMNLPDGDLENLRKRVERVVYNPENATYFDSKYVVKTECEILYKDAEGNIKICRPDRIVLTPNETWIVDFKTGEKNENNYKKYMEQIKKYEEVLSSMKYPNVSGKLLYVDKMICKK